jgi:ATP-binding cassette subfamily B protein
MAAVYRDDSDKEPRTDRRRLAVLWRLTALLRPHAARFVLAVVMLLCASGITLCYPQAARYAIDIGMATGSHDAGRLDWIVLGLVVLVAVNGAFIWLRHYSMSWLGERVVTDLRALVFDRILMLDLAWFHERRSGELVGRLASDVTVVEDVVGSELPMAMRNFVQMVGALAMLLVIDVRLTLLMLAIVPPIVVVTVYFGRKIRGMTRAVQDRLAQVSGQVQESIGAIATVQAFVQERREAARYRDGIEGAFRQSLVLFRWRSWFFATAMTSGYVGVAAVIWIGGRALIAGDLSAGDLTSFCLYTLIVAGALADLAQLWSSLQRAAGATDRLFQVVDTIPAIRDPDVPVALPAGKGAVAFEGVTFAYPSRAKPVLREVALDIPAGEVVAVVGPSGAGKSTLLALLYRFHDVGAGRITLDGVDIRRLRLGELRHALAIVAQEPVLFSGSIRDNIAYGARTPVTDAQVEQAARDAHAHDFITSFPDGYATVVGERGTKLSGGQKQRVALARALLADPRVLILDEATSNLDAESEAAVQAALARLMEGRTTLIIAHRLSTVRDADRIVVLDGGAIVELGGHDELMARRGVYHRLVEHQLVLGAGPAATSPEPAN